MPEGALGKLALGLVQTGDFAVLINVNARAGGDTRQRGHGL